MAQGRDEDLPESALTYPVICSTLRPGDFVMLRNRPCKIKEISYTMNRPRKAVIFGFDFFTNGKVETVYAGVEIQVPVCKNLDYILLDMNDGYCNLMNPETFELRNDLKLPKGELGKRIKREFDRMKGADVMVTVLSACNEEGIIDVKTSSQT